MRKIIIATHHKSGTVWMENVFRQVKAKLPFTFLNYQRYVKNPEKSEAAAKEAKREMVIFNPHATIRPEHFTPEYRILHLYRDPRDILVSATHYHTRSTERWLHRPGYGDGRTQSYQSVINSLPNLEERILFEMGHYSSRVTFRAMSKWQPNRPNVFEIRYEDLICDEDTKIFADALTFLGFDQAEREVILPIYWDNSLFGGLKDDRKRAAVAPKGTQHIRSGEAEQWIDVFTPKIAAEFESRFGSLLRKFGYESDNAWVKQVA